MAIAINNERYETKPIDCWARMKELRRERFWRSWEVQKKGGLMIMGMYANSPVLFGFGDFANASIGTHFTRLARTPNAEGLVQAIEAAEAGGLGRNICGAMKEHIGQVFQGLSTTSPEGEQIKHDLVIGRGCYAISKTSQIAAEYLDVPFTYYLDPPSSGRDDMPQISKKYWVAHTQDFIEWIEKTTGREYDDEAFIEAVKNRLYCGVKLAKCMDLLKNTPAPASLRDMFTLRMPVMLQGHRKESADYVTILYDELKDRVDNKISSRGLEKIRLTYENVFPLHRPDVLRSPDHYGAMFIHGGFVGEGYRDRLEDGSTVPAKTPEEQGIELKTREDALNAMADCGGMGERDYDFHKEFYRRVKDWNCAGVVIQYDRTCQHAMIHTPEAKLYLEEKDIPVGTYSCPQGDPREFDEKRVYRDLNTFYESLGLTRLDD